MKRFAWLLALCALVLSPIADATIYSVNQNKTVYIGSSSDAKPTGAIQSGSQFYESDTGKTYYWTGTSDNQGTTANWVEYIPRVSLGTLLSCEDQTLSSCWVSLAGTPVNINTAASTQAKASAGETMAFYVNSTGGGTVRFYNQVNATCNANPIGGVITPAVGPHAYGGKFSTGICVLTTGVIDLTLFYR